MTRKQMLLTGALFALFGVTLFAIAAGRGLSIDEHGFVATGTLLAREGSLPYRDYPWFHTPNLTFAYALVFRLTEYLLLSARLLSVLCTWVMLMLIGGVAWRALGPYPQRTRWLLALGAVLLLFSNPLTRYTSWRAWNHSAAILLVVGALTCLWRGAAVAASRWWFFFGGVLLALGIGTRLTVAPLAAAFVGVTLLRPGEIAFRDRLAQALVLTAGGIIGALPILWMFATAPEAFLFGVVTWHGPISALFRVSTGGAQEITLARRLLFPVREILSNVGNLALVALFVSVQVAAFRRARATLAIDFRNLLVLACVACGMIGAVAPSTPHHQHYYAIVPLLVLGLIQPLRLMNKSRPALPRWLTWGFGAAVALSLASTRHDYKHLKRLASPGEWIPLKIHAAGRQLAALTGRGRVVTAAPITPLEGGLRIEPSFATGPFGWRTAPFIPVQQRHAFGFVGPDELPGLLARDPPAALCTGSIPGPEQAFLEYATSHGYRPQTLTNRETAWLPPVD